MSYCDLLAQVDLCQNVLNTLSASNLPDGGFNVLVRDRPVPRLELVPNSSLKEESSASEQPERPELQHARSVRRRLTQRRKHLLLWRKEGGPRCYQGSSCARSLVRDNKSNRVEALVCSHVWKKQGE